MQQESLPASLVMEAMTPEQVRSQEQQQVADMQQKLAPITARLESDLTMAISQRKPIEERWLRDTEQHSGMYDSKTQALLNDDPERSAIFINITEPKTSSWVARLWDLLFPNDDKNWGIEPTPVPELEKAAEQAAREAQEADAAAEAAVEESNAMVESGAPPEQVAAVQQQAIAMGQMAMRARAFDAQANARREEAKKRTERMEAEIDDQLVECNYSATARDVIQDACKLGSGIVKGPITVDRPIRRWSMRGGQTALNMQTEIKPEYRRVDPWNFYPDPDVACIADAGFTFERHPVGRHKFKAMAQRLGFHMPTVREILREGVMPGTNADLTYVNRLRAIEGDSTNGTPMSLYLVWEYHGYLQNSDVVMVLRNFGNEELAQEIEESDDPFAERRVVAYFCNGRMLKISADYPMDSGESLYSIFSFQRPESMILGGKGIPWMMRHEQSMLNAGVRMLMDNAGLAVAPQTVVDKAKVTPADGRWKVTPRKVWHRDGEAMGPNDRPFEFFTVPMNAQLLQVIIDMALKFIDMVVSLPMIAQGEQGPASNTMGGMSMLFNSANVVFRRVVKNWDDDVTSPAIRRAYDWNMQFSDKEDIKGDMKVDARGTSVLLVREVQSQMMMAIATNWSAHPVLGPAVKVYGAMRLTLQAMAINPNDVLVTPEEFEAKLKAMAEAPQESPEMIRAQATIEAAKISAASSQVDSEARLQVANLNRETAILNLMVRGDVDVKKIMASLEAQRMQIDSDERKLAVEAALEERNAQRAAQMGREPTGSGGTISMGSEARS